MPRVKNSVATRKRRKKFLNLLKDILAKKQTFRVANQQVMKSLSYAYRDRKVRKRFSQALDSAINAATRNNGLSYSKFMNGLKKGIEVNRKCLLNLPSAT